MKYPKISVVIGSYNRAKFLQLCIESVREELIGEAYEIIVVDGGSTDGSVQWLVDQRDVILILQHNRGQWRGADIERKPWAYFMNLAFKCATGRYVCMLSDDSIIVPGAIKEGVNVFDERISNGEKVGGVAFYFRDLTNLASSPGREGYAVAVNLGNLYVNHGLFLNEGLREVGYCDESFHFYFADSDLAMKLTSAGYSIVESPKSFVEHIFAATPKIRATNNDARKQMDRMHLIEKWEGIGFPAEQKEDFVKKVGYWKYHPTGYADPHDTIGRIRTLVAVTEETRRSFIDGATKLARKIQRKTTGIIQKIRNGRSTPV